MPGAEATKRRRMPQSGKMADGKERDQFHVTGGQGRQLSPFGNAYLRSQVPPLRARRERERYIYILYIYIFIFSLSLSLYIYII